MASVTFTRRYTSALLILILCAAGLNARQATGVLRGRVVDEAGAVVPGVTVSAVDVEGATKTASTNSEGGFVIPGLMPGRYTVRALMSGFNDFEAVAVEVTAPPGESFEIKLSVALATESVDVHSGGGLSIEADGNANGLTLRGSDLDVLPDDPDQLAAALLALAGPAAGPNGGEIILDGFAGGRIPPKESIREIRINKNPFSSEFDRVGYGRVEILTQPGSETRFRGQASFNFNDEALNSRNPFAPARAPFQSRLFGGNINGPLVARRASIFLDFQRREIDDNAVVNATILDASLNPVRFSQAVLTPQRFTTVSPRFDYQFNALHSLIARYAFSRWGSRNDGVGEFSLPSRAFDSSRTEQLLQVSETAIINEEVVNDIRFQYTRHRLRQEGDDSQPTIRIPETFVGGGSPIGLSLTNEDRVELQNVTSFMVGPHVLRAGGRVRGVRVDSVSRANFNGTFTFHTLEQYRQALLDLPGARPTLFSVAAGDTSARVSQWDVAGFVQDDWRVRPNFTLNFGLRYERQTNISSNYNFAPRAAFVWAPGSSGTQQPRTIVRGGVGIFYERFREDLTLQARRFDGARQSQFVVADSFAGGDSVLDLFPLVPTLAQLAEFSIPQTTRRVAPDLQAPHLRHAAISIERQMPFNVTMTATFINSRMRHALRSRNINAPLPGGTRPFGNVGNIFVFESSGVFNQNQLIINANNRFNKRMTIFASYVLNKASSDTDGAQDFPVNSHDPSTEYGPSALDVRHRFFLSGFVSLPLKLSFTPFILYSTGRPFNITTGRDANGDTLFTERPALASDLSVPGLILTRFGAFDPNPLAGAGVIGHNFGREPSFFSVNFGLSRSFKFGDMPSPSKKTDADNPLGQLLDSVGPKEKRYELTLSVRVQNILNRTNATTPVGNLSSPQFGQTTQSVGPYGSGISTAGNRRFEGQVRLSF